MYQNPSRFFFCICLGERKSRKNKRRYSLQKSKDNTSKECVTPGETEYGRVRVNGKGQDAIAAYKCNMGFWTNQNLIRICNADGKWSGKLPVCVKG